MIDKYRIIKLSKHVDGIGLMERVTIETNGMQGGDAGHGGFFTFRFTGPSMGGLDYTVTNTSEGLTITARGDREISALADALKTAGKFIETYEKEIYG